MQTTGLQLCDAGASSSSGAARCEAKKDGCMGAVADYCWPYHVWSGTYISTGVYRGFALIGSEGFTTYVACDGTGSCGMAIPFSVRCVLDLVLLALSGLQLCEANESSKYGAVQCSGLDGGCQGAYYWTDAGCWPYGLWSGSKGSSSGSYIVREFDKGAYIFAPTRLVTHAYSVRCVPDLECRPLACSSAKQVRVLLTVLHSAVGWFPAARVLLVIIAGLTGYGVL